MTGAQTVIIERPTSARVRFVVYGEPRRVDGNLGRGRWRFDERDGHLLVFRYWQKADGVWFATTATFTVDADTFWGSR
jgi:hypothetical protein